MDNPKVLIPLIRRIIPGIIAEDIVRVQPMVDFKVKFEFGVSYDPCNFMPEWYWVKGHNASISQYNEMRKYCEETFGKNGGELWMSSDSDIPLRRFLFTHEKDQMLFLLRWS